MLAGSHLASSVDIVYVHSLNLLLKLPLIHYPSLHLLPQCLNMELLKRYQLGVVYLSSARGRKNMRKLVFHPHSEKFPNNLRRKGKDSS